MYLSLLLFPIFGSVIAGLFGRKVGVTGSHIITCLCLLSSASLAIVAFYEIGLSGSSLSIYVGNWINSELMDISWGFMFDSLTVSIQDKKDFFISTLFIIPVVQIGKQWANIYNPKAPVKYTNCREIVV